MPYTVDTVPDNVNKKYAPQWVEVFNRVYAAAKADKKSDSEAEEAAFKQANGVMKSRKEDDARDGSIVQQTASAEPRMNEFDYGPGCGGGRKMRLMVSEPGADGKVTDREATDEEVEAYSKQKARSGGAGQQEIGLASKPAPIPDSPAAPANHGIAAPLNGFRSDCVACQSGECVEHRYSEDQPREGGKWVTSSGAEQHEGQKYTTTSHATKSEAVEHAKTAREHGHTVGVFKVVKAAGSSVQPIGNGKGTVAREGSTHYEVQDKTGTRAVDIEVEERYSEDQPRDPDGKFGSGGAGSKSEADNIAAGLKAESDKEKVHGIVPGDKVSPKGTDEIHTVISVSGNTLNTHQEGSGKITTLHASKVEHLTHTGGTSVDGGDKWTRSEIRYSEDQPRHPMNGQFLPNDTQPQDIPVGLMEQEEPVAMKEGDPVTNIFGTTGTIKSVNGNVITVNVGDGTETWWGPHTTRGWEPEIEYR